MSRRVIDPAERPEQRPRVERIISARPPGRARVVLRPDALDTRLVGGVYETIPCSRPGCEKLAVATSDPEARLCLEHA